MFTFNEPISEGDALAKMKASRAPDSTEQPAAPDVVDVSEDTPVEAQEAEPQGEALTTDTEELEVAQDQESEAQEDEGDLFYYDLDGEEVSSAQLKEWKDNGLMQADYTRKTQELSESRKAFEDEQKKFNEKSAQLEAKLAEVQAIIDEETPSAETLAEWREYEPEKLLDYQEKTARRKELVGKAKDVIPNSEPVQHDYSSLLEKNPEWTQDGKTTDAYAKDMQAMTQYANSVGMSTEEAAQLSPTHLQILLDATRFNSNKAKSAVVTKKVRKAPVSTKPKAQAQSSVKSEIEAIQSRLKKYGKEEDFVKLRKLQRQINN